MDDKYTITRLADGIAHITPPGKPKQVWMMTTSGSRIECRCVVCGVFFRLGSLLYRPIGNPKNRRDRICEPCVLGVRKPRSSQ